MADEYITEDEINQHFVAMGHSVDLIDATIADDTEAKKMNGGPQGSFINALIQSLSENKEEEKVASIN
jgi:hypothetical protein